MNEYQVSNLPEAEEASQSKRYAFAHHNKMTDALAAISSDDATLDAENRVYSIRRQETEIIIPAKTEKKEGQQIEEIKALTPIGVNTSKVEEWINVYFTAKMLPTELEVLSKDQRTVRFLIREFAEVCGKKTEIDESAKDVTKEYARVKNRRKEYKSQLARDLDSLTAMHVRWIDEDGEWTKGANYISDWDMDKSFNGFVTIVLADKYAESLLHSSTTPLPLALFQVDARNPNVFSLGRFMSRHYNMHSNIKAGRNRHLQVATALKYVDLPSIQEVEEKDRGHWIERIRDPFEKCLSELTKIGVFKKMPIYIGKSGSPLSDREIDIRSYEEWSLLYLEYDVSAESMPDQAKLIKQIETNRREGMKRARKEKASKKGTPTTKATVDEQSTPKLPQKKSTQEPAPKPEAADEQSTPKLPRKKKKQPAESGSASDPK